MTQLLVFHLWRLFDIQLFFQKGCIVDQSLIFLRETRFKQIATCHHVYQNYAEGERVNFTQILAVEGLALLLPAHDYFWSHILTRPRQESIIRVLALRCF